MKLSNPALLREQCYIGGQWLSGSANLEVNNPASGEIIDRVPRMGAEQARLAITAAEQSLPAWRQLTAQARANLLLKWYQLILDNQQDLARLITAEEGKPLTALALCALAEHAGIPPGALNVITGDSAAMGGEFTASPVVRKLSFTGSTPVGIKLLEHCAATVKKVTMELGGNAPFIVFEDADLEAAVEGALIAKFRNAGQTCVCANRFYVQAGVYDAFLQRFQARVAELSVGDGSEVGTLVGPMIDARAVEDVEAMVREAERDGARVLIGGRRHALGGGLRADGAGRCAGWHAGGTGGDFRPGRASVSFHRRGAGDRCCQRHTLRPGLLCVCA